MNLVAISIGDWASLYERGPSNEQRIWKLLAYVGRYGHQPVTVARSLTVRELRVLADAVAEIVGEENASGKMPGAND